MTIMSQLKSVIICLGISLIAISGALAADNTDVSTKLPATVMEASEEAVSNKRAGPIESGVLRVIW